SPVGGIVVEVVVLETVLVGPPQVDVPSSRQRRSTARRHAAPRLPNSLQMVWHAAIRPAHAARHARRPMVSARGEPTRSPTNTARIAKTTPTLVTSRMR